MKYIHPIPTFQYNKIVGVHENIIQIGRGVANFLCVTFSLKSKHWSR